ncbi:MAG: acyl carrier protein [Desulfobacterales bacterium]|jgi:acyl carrier protein|nr:acyl carrier protein [Desulfobacteraceae bacterium]MDD3991198.1 acyl carrier protein [Desulfobacteraceae bacterium]MDY0313324.1 acyl carrier protein [Desulfobacterales bacterium]
MTEDHIRREVLALIQQIAPEADLNHLDPTARFRDQFDFDSVDFVNFAAGLQERLKVSIPEQDYPRLATLESAVSYLTSRTTP